MLSNLALNKIAVNFKSLVAAVQINDAVTVTEFEINEVENNVYVVAFGVPLGIPHLINLKLLGADNEVLTNSGLTVPVETEARFKFKITFRNAR